MPFDSVEPSRAEQFSSGTQRPASTDDSKELSGAEDLRSLRTTGPETESKTAENGSTPAVEPEKKGAERRRYPRYKCEGSAEIRTDGSSVRTWATFSEVSLGGCYLEMMTTYPVDTKLDLKLQLRGFEVRSWATVRINYPFLGMGIAFTDMATEERQNLEAMIQTLVGPGPEADAPPTASGASQETSQPAAVNATHGPNLADSLRQFFETHEVLTREEFTKFLGNSR
jgi:hypothetical protein